VSGGALAVASEPPGADVWLDGEFQTKTPGNLMDLPAGRHELKIGKLGHLPDRRTIEIADGKTTYVTAKLVSRKVSYYQDTIARDPDSLSNLTELGRLMVLDGNLGKGFELAQRAFQTRIANRNVADKGFSELLRSLELAVPNPEAEQWGRFDRQMMAAVKADPKNRRTCQIVHGILETRHRWKQILELSRSVLGAGQQDAEVHLWRFNAAQRLRDRQTADEALAALTEMLKSGPPHLGQYRAVIHALTYVNRWKAILKLSEFAIGQGGSEAEYYFWRMAAAMELGRWRQVAENFQVLQARRGQSDQLYADKALFAGVYQAILFAGARACLELDDRTGFGEIMQQYEPHPMRHYWINLVRREQWLEARRGDPPKPWLRASRCASALTIDGIPDEAEWQKAEKRSDFYHWLSDERSDIPTAVRALYDDQCLYLTVRCDDQGRNDIQATSPDEDINALVTDTRLEIFIDANRDYRTYKQFMLSANGARGDLDCTKAIRFIHRPPFGLRHMDREWNSEFRSAVRVEADHWTLEAAFPHKVLDARPPRPGEAWSFNVVRCKPGKGREDVSFAPVYGDYHQPERHALLLFGD